MKFKVALDIGIASVGWVIFLLNSKGEPCKIIDLNARIFSSGEGKNGKSLSLTRSQSRRLRRLLRRKKSRRERIYLLFECMGLINRKEFVKRYYDKDLPNVYQLRCEALDRILSKDELAQVLLHISKYRGFKSNRKCERKDKDAGKVLAATEENRKKLEESGYRTVGEMLWKDERFRNELNELVTRNKQDDYKNTMLRSLLVDEVKQIFQSQRNLGNSDATELLEKEYISILTSQRSFDEGPGFGSPYAIDGFYDLVGFCIFEKEEKRASKGTFGGEYFVALQNIAHLRILDEAKNKRGLTKEEIDLILPLLRKRKTINYSAIRKLLNLADTDMFSELTYDRKTPDKEKMMADAEKKNFITMKNSYDIRKKIKSSLKNLSQSEQDKLIDDIGTILAYYKSDDKRMEHLSELNISNEEAEEILELNPKGFVHISLKAIYNIAPFFEQGMTYDKACTAAGYDYKNEYHGKKLKVLKGKEIQRILNEIHNPVVKRSVSVAIKVINAIIVQYGSPQQITIEMANNLDKSALERLHIESLNKKNQERNEHAKQEIQKIGIINPSGFDIVKYKLWEEQNGICIYSGEKIPLQELFFENLYQVDHILAYSITFCDKYTNLVVVKASENGQKGNQTAYQYISSKGDVALEEFKQRVDSIIKNPKKAQNLLKQEITEEDIEKFKARALNDTRYATKMVTKILRNYLEFEPYDDETKKKHVFTVNGEVTSYLRKRYGFSNKDRSDDRHHIIDAAIAGVCTEGMLKKISLNAKIRETAYIKGNVPKDENGDNISRDEWNEKYGVDFPEPYPYFAEELNIRLGENPLKFIQSHRDVEWKLDYPEWFYTKNCIKPVFISREVCRKAKGPAHQDTIRSKKSFDEKGIVITKTPLKKLKLNKDMEIKGYHNPQDSMRLYKELRQKLIEFNGNAKLAFKEPFYIMKKDGSKGRLVRSVKIEKKCTIGVDLDGCKGIANNESMVRVDVFYEDNQYFLVPVYVSDTVKDKLPNKAIVGGRPYKEWHEVNESSFMFSLYNGDVISFKSNEEKRAKSESDNEEIIINESLVYYTKTGISGGTIDGVTHDGKYHFKSINVKNLEYLKKWQVDMLGNVTEVKKEKRLKFNH